MFNIVLQIAHPFNKKELYFQESIPVGCVPPALHRDPPPPLDRDPPGQRPSSGQRPLPTENPDTETLEGTWGQRQRPSPAEGTWDQAAKQEVTLYRDPLPLNEQND